MGELDASSFLDAIPSGTHPSGCTRVFKRDKRKGNLNGVVFIDVRPMEFSQPGENLLVDLVSLGAEGCIEIRDVPLECICVQDFQPGVTENTCLYALYLQSGKFGKLSDWHSDYSWEFISRLIIDYE